MNDFSFFNPVRILFGKDQLLNIGNHIPSGKKIMLIYGGGSIFKNGVYKRVLEPLADREIIEFGGIESNPSYETCMKAVEQIKINSVDFLLAVGGGSVIDATKFIAAAALYSGGDPWEIISRNKPVDAALPFGVVLTLPATGSEMNNTSVMSRKSTQEKLSFSSEKTYPRFSVLLPDAAGSLPKNQVANGVIDAFIHVIEQYLTYPVNAPLQDRFAEAILLTLIEEGPKAYKDPTDYEAMSNLMWCATMALNGLLSCGVPGDWSVHHIGHELTALHNIDHACTLAVVLPGMWKVLREEKKEKLLQYGERIWGITCGSDDERVDAAITKTVEFFESLNVKTKLTDYGVGQETIDAVVGRFKRRGWFRRGDRGLVTPQVLREVLEDRL